MIAVSSSDWLYWSLTTFFRKQLMGLMGAPRSIVAELSFAQETLANRFITEMNPVSLRSTGDAVRQSRSAAR